MQLAGSGGRRRLAGMPGPLYCSQPTSRRCFLPDAVMRSRCITPCRPLPPAPTSEQAQQQRGLPPTGPQVLCLRFL